MELTTFGKSLFFKGEGTLFIETSSKGWMFYVKKNKDSVLIATGPIEIQALIKMDIIKYK